MPNFHGRLGRASGMIVAVAASIAVGLATAIVISGLIGRVEKLESDLRTAQTKIVELTASQSRLSASIDTVDRSIRSLKSDLDHPRVQPLASILGSGAHLRQ